MPQPLPCPHARSAQSTPHLHPVAPTAAPPGRFLKTPQGMLCLPCCAASAGPSTTLEEPPGSGSPPPRHPVGPACPLQPGAQHQALEQPLPRGPIASRPPRTGATASPHHSPRGPPPPPSYPKPLLPAGPESLGGEPREPEHGAWNRGLSTRGLAGSLCAQVWGAQLSQSRAHRTTLRENPGSRAPLPRGEHAQGCQGTGGWGRREGAWPFRRRVRLGGRCLRAMAPPGQSRWMAGAPTAGWWCSPQDR